MKKYQIHSFTTAREAALALAELILSRLKQSIKLSKPLNVAVSGGNTPKILFDILAEKYTEKMPWKFLRLFWVDERCVPPTSDESNFGMMYKSLLQHVDLPSNNIFRMEVEKNSEAELAHYTEILNRQLPEKDGIPLFDLVLLGIGNDGHTASIFPNTMELLDSNDFVALSEHPESGQKRITLTAKTICNADEIVFFVTGNDKAKILAEIIDEKKSSKKYPAAHITNNKGQAIFFLDKEAAKEISAKELQSYFDQ